MAEEDIKKKRAYTTQRVDVETANTIKTINLHLARRGVNMRQSDIISAAFKFIKNREWDFIEFIELGETKKKDSLFDTVFKVTSRPWFPYGELGG